MTVLGAVVFGGLLALGVLWLLVTAPTNEVDEGWHLASVDTPDSVPDGWALTHSSYS